MTDYGMFNGRIFLQQELLKIAEQLISEKEIDNGLYYWKTLKLNEGNMSFEVEESIYNGVAGIILFFIDLYHKYPDEQYLDVIVNGCKWLIKHSELNPTENYAFYTGRLGIAYTLFKAANCCDDSSFYDYAMSICVNFNSSVSDHLKIYDLINGHAGILVALILFHEKTNAPIFIEMVNKTLHVLIKNARVGPKGYYWDPATNITTGLCGLSHGVSGIAWAIMETGNYFNNTALIKFAEEAIKYESYYYNVEFGNWPDFRTSIPVKRSEADSFLVNVLNEVNTDFFNKKKFATAWCHGAPGIGLARLRNFAITKRKCFKADLDNALKTTEKSLLLPIYESDTLCHGNLGNSFLLFAAERYGLVDELEKDCLQIAIQAVDRKKSRGYYTSGFKDAANMEDRSLFLGIAGIGYHLLHLVHKIPLGDSILLPYPAKKSVTSIDFTETKIKQIILHKYFKDSSLENTENFFCKKSPFNLKKVNKGIREHNQGNTTVQNIVLQLSRSEQNFAYRYAMQLLLNEKISNLGFPKAEVKNCRFILLPWIKLYSNRKDDKHYLIRFAGVDYIYQEISAVLYSILTAISVSNNLTINEICQLFNTSETVRLKKYVEEQIVECLCHQIVDYI